MTVKLNGKPFDFDSDDFLEGYHPNIHSREQTLVFANIIIWGFISYQIIEWLFKVIFLPFLTIMGLTL